MRMREILACVVFGIGLFGCTSGSDRVEPNRKGLDSFIKDNEGRVLPLTLDGKSLGPLYALIDGERIHHCMAGSDGEAIDAKTCRTDQPFSGFSASLGTLNTKLGPCYGGPSVDMTGRSQMMAICVAILPLSGVNAPFDEQMPYFIAAGQVFYYYQSGGDEAVLFSLEPMSDEALRNVAAASRSKAQIESAATDAAAEAKAAVIAVESQLRQQASNASDNATDAANTTVVATDVSEEAIDVASAADNEANAREATARTERLQAEAKQRLKYEEAQRIADQRAIAVQEAEQRELDKARREADALKRLQDEHAAKLDAEGSDRN